MYIQAPVANNDAVSETLRRESEIADTCVCRYVYLFIHMYII